MEDPSWPELESTRACNPRAIVTPRGATEERPARSFPASGPLLHSASATDSQGPRQSVRTLRPSEGIGDAKTGPRSGRPAGSPRVISVQNQNRGSEGNEQTTGDPESVKVPNRELALDEGLDRSDLEFNPADQIEAQVGIGYPPQLPNSLCRCRSLRVVSLLLPSRDAFIASVLMVPPSRSSDEAAKTDRPTWEFYYGMDRWAIPQNPRPPAMAPTTSRANIPIVRTSCEETKMTPSVLFSPTSRRASERSRRTAISP